MIKYKKTGELMSLQDVLAEIMDTVGGAMEGNEITNVYNDTVLDKIEYVGDSVWKKVDGKCYGLWNKHDPLKEEA